MDKEREDDGLRDLDTSSDDADDTGLEVTNDAGADDLLAAAGNLDEEVADDRADEEEEEEAGEEEPQAAAQQEEQEEQEEERPEARNDDDLSGLSPNVKKRIARERHLRFKALADADERIISLERENAMTRAKVIERDVKDADSAIAKAKADLEAAIEAGETKKQVEAQAALNDAQRLRENLNEKKVSFERAAKTIGYEVERPNMRANQWLARNGWMRDKDPRYARAQADAKAIDRELFAEGKLEPRSTAYYEELNRRINEKHKGLARSLEGGYDMSDRDRRGPPRGDGRGSPVRGSPRSARDGNARPSRGGVRLSEGEKAEMRRFGLNPDVKEHVAQFVVEGRALK